MSTSTAGAIDLAVMVVWIVATLAAMRAVRRRVAVIEESSEPVSERVHRLQKLMLACMGWMLATYAVLGVLGGISATTKHHTKAGHHTSPVAVTVVLVLMLLILLPEIRMLRTVRKSLRRVRGTTTEVPHKRRRMLASIAVTLCYAAILVVGAILVPRHGTGHAIGIALVYVVAFVVFASVLVPLILIRMVSNPMPAAIAAPLERLAETMGVRVRGFRTMATRGQKAANAMQVGTLPGLRYVIVTDYLSDHLDEGQLAAVVAHELGHARPHHLLRKVAVTLCTWAVAETLLIAIGHAAGASTLVTVLTPALALLIPVSMILMQGLVGVRDEREADDIAAQCVGREELAGALRCLGDLNDMKRDTGRGWSLLTQHPGLQERLGRLAPSTRAPRVAATR